MSVTAILLPVFALVGLTFFLLVWMGSGRFTSLRTGQLSAEDAALTGDRYPKPVLQRGRAFSNQFELPVLFYVLVALALVTRKADLTFVVLSWIFVATRFVHAFIHTTSNRLSARFSVYLIGMLILLLMWVLFALSIIASEILY
jgi:hypothetical protein